MKLAIAVVYMVSPENGPLLRVHLDRIAAHTHMPYRIYGVPVRLDPALRGLLDRDDLRLVPVPRTDLPGAAEHSYYLRALFEAALADGAEYLCTLHVDSFPVRDGWDETLRGHVDGGAALASLPREEQDFVPSTACLFLRAAFWREHAAEFILPGAPTDDPGLAAFRRRSDCDDSGVVWGYWLDRDRLAWHRLQRSNIADDHRFVAGLYDDLIFHLGGHMRQAAWTMMDRQELQGARLRAAVRRMIPSAVLRAVPASAKAPLRASELRRRQENEAAFAQACRQLFADPDAYIAHLRGDGPRERSTN